MKKPSLSEQIHQLQEKHHREIVKALSAVIDKLLALRCGLTRSSILRDICERHSIVLLNDKATAYRLSKFSEFEGHYFKRDELLWVGASLAVWLNDAENIRSKRSASPSNRKPKLVVVRAEDFQKQP